MTDLKRTGTFASAWGHRRWRWLLSGFAVSVIGDYLYSVALVVFLIDRTGSAGWVSAAVIGRLLPYALLSAPAGLLADRMDRRRLMVTLDLVRAGLLAAMAVPSMLLAFGISLRLGPRPATGKSAEHVWTIVVLKTLVMPAVALGVAMALGMRGQPLFAVVVTAALPTAQNIFTYAIRYRREVHLARDAVFISTFVSVPVILGIAALFHAIGGV